MPWTIRHLLSLPLCCLLVVPALPCAGEVSTDLPGAILVFPKVQSDPQRDTIIQITNNTGIRVFLRCFYVDGRDSRDAPWLVTDFQITLTQNQPTVWVAGQGLPAIPSDRPESLYPGPVPPVGDGFQGALRCVVVDESERPVGINALTGEATIIDRQTAAASNTLVSPYRASLPTTATTPSSSTMSSTVRARGCCC